jgi:hypothetical protein
VSVSGTALTSERTRIGPASAQAQPVLITITLPATGGPTRVLLRGSADAPSSARVYLAAVTLR